MFQCIEVVGIPDITEIYSNQKYQVNIYFTDSLFTPVWVTGVMQGDEISKLVNAGIRIEFHNTRS
jgi:hypothetical protein